MTTPTSMSPSALQLIAALGDRQLADDHERGAIVRVVAHAVDSLLGVPARVQERLRRGPGTCVGGHGAPREGAALVT